MKLKLLSMSTIAALTLVGCQGYNNNNEEGQPGNTTYEQTRFNDDNVDRNDNNRLNDNNLDDNGLFDNNNDNMDNNRNSNNVDVDNRYEVSEEAAERIVDQVREIDQAYVLTTENNAYVAAVLNDDNNRTRNKNVGNNNNNNNNNRIQRTNDANNGRGATDGEELTDKVKNQIADIVQSVDNDIDNVYVSTNPDFVDLSNDYINDLNEGRPIQGFFDQIGNTIERIFPQNKR